MLFVALFDGEHSKQRQMCNVAAAAEAFAMSNIAYIVWVQGGIIQQCPVLFLLRECIQNQDEARHRRNWYALVGQVSWCASLAPAFRRTVSGSTAAHKSMLSWGILE